MATPLVKTRFCPSPTGHMHLGNARTALFNALYATGQGGTLLLRIEDTDQTRSEHRFTEQLMADMRWLGMEWKEGAESGGTHGPYYQSQRQGIYDGYYDLLIEQGLAYDCYCSQEQLALARKMQLRAGQPPRYPGTCRHLSAEQKAKKAAEGIAPTLRFRMPDGIEIRFDDLVKGPQKFLSNDIGDFVIRRADGTAPFMYCNAIDDALMGVTCVLRGEDHLTNTPRQILLLEKLGLAQPHYGHISLITDMSGGKLSKREGSLSIHDLKKDGFLPLAITNYLARLGHTYDDNTLMPYETLAQGFQLNRLGKAAAKFDSQQLQYWQRYAVMALSDGEMLAWLHPALGDALSALTTQAQQVFAKWVQPNINFPAEAAEYLEMVTTDTPVVQAEAQAILAEVPAAFFEVAETAIATHGTAYPAVCDALKDAGYKGKALFKPLRAALTGMAAGPELADALVLMGADKARARLKHAATVAQG